MRFDRKLWLADYYDVFPAWPCPNCKQTALERDISKEWLIYETADSAEAHADENWDPSWITERAAGALVCKHCKEPVIMSAVVGYEEDVDKDLGDRILVQGFKPLYFEPPLEMIDVPSETADDVRLALTRAFSLYWSDPSSSGNCTRTALELMLDQQGIARGRNDSKRGERVRRSLHERLEMFAKRRPELKETLMAVKWLGNAGTHDVLTHADVLDAFELLDHTLDEVYRQRSKRILRTAKAINRAKGPVKKSKRKP